MDQPAEDRVVEPQPMKVVCFDLGGVLVRISRSWQEACERAGIDPALADLASINMLKASGNAARFQRGEIEFEEFIAGQVEQLECRVNETDLKRIHANWLVEGVSEMTSVIERINQAGLVTASLSNTDPEHWKTLRDMDVVKALAIQGLSFEMGLLKPDPEIYHEAEVRFDACGSSILFFDDLPENVRAAEQCGWNAVQVDPMEPAAPQVDRGLAAFGITA